MQGNLRHGIAGLAALFACALVVAGCGGGGSDTTATTAPGASAGGNAQQKIDAAVKSCNEKAQEVGGTAQVTLQGACNLVGASAKQAAQQGGAKAKQALSQAADSCRKAVGQLPSTEAQDALSSLCEAIGSAE